MRCLPMVLLLALALTAGANTELSPYAEQQARDIKTLSESEVTDYLNGGGMGLARAAELNHYPGPRHVIELEDELDLTADQRRRVQAVFDDMQIEATALGARIVNEERALNRLFAENGVTYQRLQAQVNEIARLQGELRYVHLRAHIATRAILTPSQLEQYDNLRGYRAHDTHAPRGSH